MFLHNDDFHSVELDWRKSYCRLAWKAGSARMSEADFTEAVRVRLAAIAESRPACVFDDYRAFGFALNDGLRAWLCGRLSAVLNESGVKRLALGLPEGFPERDFFAQALALPMPKPVEWSAFAEEAAAQPWLDAIASPRKKRSGLSRT